MIQQSQQSPIPHLDCFSIKDSQLSLLATSPANGSGSTILIDDFPTQSADRGVSAGNLACVFLSLDTCQASAGCSGCLPGAAVLLQLSQGAPLRISLRIPIWPELLCLTVPLILSIHSHNTFLLCLNLSFITHVFVIFLRFGVTINLHPGKSYNIWY